MFYILAIIIVLYSSVNLVFRRNPTFLQIRHFVDLATLVVTAVFVIVWFELFAYSFWFFIYLLLSLGLIVYLILRLKKVEFKKKKAEETIKVLKDEEQILETEIDSLEKKKVDAK